MQQIMEVGTTWDTFFMPSPTPTDLYDHEGPVDRLGRVAELGDIGVLCDVAKPEQRRGCLNG